MFYDQKTLAMSWFDSAMAQYVDACDQYTDLYEPGKTLDTSAHASAATRLKYTYDRMKTIVKVSNYKFGLNLSVPILLVDPSMRDKVS